MTPCVECKKAKINQDSFTSFLSLFLSFFIESSWNLMLCVPKWFDTTQVLKMFSFLLRVVYIISAHVTCTKTEDWQAIVARNLVKTS